MPGRLSRDGLRRGQGGPPRALACLAKWYPVEPVKVDGAWHFKLAGTTHPWDDGQTKSFEAEGFTMHFEYWPELLDPSCR